MTTGKTIALTRWTLVSKVMSLLFNMLSRLVIASLQRSKHLLISWLQSPSAVILEPPKTKFVTVSIVSPSICYEVMRPDAMVLVFWMLSFKPTFSLSSFTFNKRLSSSSLLSSIRVVSSVYLRLLIFLLTILIPAYTSFNLAFHMKYSAYKLNKQVTRYSLDVLLSQFGTSLLFYVQFWLLLLNLHTDFSGGRSGGLVFPSLSEFSTVSCDPHCQRFDVVNKAEVFLELSCFLNNPVDIGNLISGSSAFSKSNLNTWKLTVHTLLNPGLEDFEHYLLAREMSASVW